MTHSICWVPLAAMTAALSVSSPALALDPPCFTAQAERVIDAPYDLVFDTIVDSGSYPDWNPYVVKVTPALDLSQVGAEFVLTVDQPFQLLDTESPEKTIAAQLPGEGEASLVYAFNSPLAGLVGNPERIQRFLALSADRTLYQTEETFCSYLLPLLPLASVQTGFWLQARALETEAEARYLASSP